jgi:predicted dehydrogenase
VSSSSYRILLVSGQHTHQELYAPAFASDGRCRLIAVADEKDIDPGQHALNEQLAASLSIPYIPDLSQALMTLDVNVASICAPPERRGRLAMACATAGKHLYLDKPLVPTLSEADALVAAVREAGVRSHMFSFVTQPWAQTARHALAERTLGEVRAIHAEVFFAKGPAGTAALGNPRQEEFPPQRQQHGPVKRELDNCGVYPITLVSWLTGQKFATVYGMTANYFFQQHQQHDVEDFALLAGTLENGTPVTIATGRIGWSASLASVVQRITVLCSERSFVVDANRPRLEIYNDAPPWTPPVHPEDPMGFWESTQREVGVRPRQTWLPIAPSAPRDVSYFLDCLDAGRESELSVREAAHATEVILAGYLSAATGQVVTLPLPRTANPAR